MESAHKIPEGFTKGGILQLLLLAYHQNVSATAKSRETNIAPRTMQRILNVDFMAYSL